MVCPQGRDHLLVEGWEVHTRRTEPGWLPQEASTFIDACSGPADFLVSLLLREGGPAKAVQAVGSA